MSEEDIPGGPSEGSPGLSYSAWLYDVGLKMQGPEMAPDANEFGQHLLEVARFLNQQQTAIQVLSNLNNQNQAGQTPESDGYPAGALHMDPKVANQLAGMDFIESLALLSYRNHQSGMEGPVDATVESIARNIVLFLTNLRNSPELLNKFAAAFNYYSQKSQERMTMSLNAFSDTIH